MEARSKLMRSILVKGPVLELGLWLAEEETSDEEAVDVVGDEDELVSIELDGLSRLDDSSIEDEMDSTPHETRTKMSKLTIPKDLIFISFFFL
jgi:hypothetical protein